MSDAQLYVLQKESEKNASSFFEAVSMKKELAHLSKSILDLYVSSDTLSLPDVYFAVCKHTRFLFGAYMDKSQSINVRESLSRMVTLLQRFSTKNQGYGMAEFLKYFAYALHSEQDSEE
ncbi:hypothetical protein RZS08_54760, partial [Arthrospira platensis SPKY1]|nr:hypothetical protein [Arthrospira platensis SPKY1]